MENKVCGIGFNDVVGITNTKAYKVWYSMLNRCYNEKNNRYENYGGRGVYVCDDWLYFSNFKKWFDINYIDGYEIDKDIKSKEMGLAIPYYSPNTCVFVSKTDNLKEIHKNEDYKPYRSLVYTKNKKIYNTFFKDLTPTELGRILLLMYSENIQGRLMYGGNHNQICKTYKDIVKILNMDYESFRKKLLPTLKKQSILREIKTYKGSYISINPVLSLNGLCLDIHGLCVWEDYITEFNLK